MKTHAERPEDNKFPYSHTNAKKATREFFSLIVSAFTTRLFILCSLFRTDKKHQSKNYT